MVSFYVPLQPQLDTTSENPSKKRKQHLEPHRLQPFSIDEFYHFLAILLYAADENCRDFRKLWNMDRRKGGLHPEVRDLMSRNRFLLMHSCFIFTDEEMMGFEKVIQMTLDQIWVPASYAVCDESLVPHKGRRNPHHVFIMRKPHPHGVKVKI